MQSDETYRMLCNSIDQGLCLMELVYDEAGKVVDLVFREQNASFDKHTGLGNVVGKKVSGLLPQFEDYLTNIYSNVAATGEAVQTVEYVRDVGRWYSIKFSVAGGTGSKWVAMALEDVTALKERERALSDAETIEEKQEFLLKLSDALRPLSDPLAIEHETLRLLRTHLKAPRATYAEAMDQDGAMCITSESVNEELAPMKGTIVRLSDFMPDVLAEAMLGKPVWREDVLRDDHQAEQQAGYPALKARSWVMFPLVKDGRFLANLTVHYPEPRIWTAQEIELIQEAGERSWAAIEHARAEKALQQSEEKFRTLFESVDEGFSIIELIFDDAGNVVDFIYLENNPAFIKHVGMDLQGKKRSELSLDQKDFLLEKYQHLVKTGEPLHFEYNVQNLGGQWFQVTATRIGREDSRHLGVVFRNITQRKRQEKLQEFLLQLSDALRTINDPLEIQRSATRVVGEYLQVDCALYNEVRDNGRTIHIEDNYIRGDFPKVTGDFAVSDFGEAMDILRRGEILIIEDQASTPLKQPSAREASMELGVFASATVPLIKQGRWVANFGVLHGSPRKWTQNEITVLQETAERTWAAAERASAEAAMRDSAKRLRLATEAADMATWEWDLAQNLVIWNEQHYRIFGLEPTGAPVKPELFFEHVHPADRDRVDNLLRESLANDGEFDTEFRALRADGTERWMSGYGRVMERTAAGPVLMSGVMFDITARRQAEKELRRIEERQSAILESAADYAIFTLDLNLRVRDWNAGAEYVLGYSEEEIIGQPGEIFFVPEDREKGAPELEKKKAIEEGRAENERWHLRKDGSRFYGSGITSPLLDDAGNVMGVLKVMRDLTVQKQAEDALKEADRRKDEFLAMLAHELRNPISTVRNGLSILKLTHGADSQVSEIVGMMDNQTTHLVRMIDDLLDVSRVTQGKIELKSERLDLNALLTNTIQAIRPQYESRGKILHEPVMAREIFVQGDATRLSQVVTNLLTNSLRYTGIDGQVWVSLAAENGEAVIAVKDNGIGLTVEQQTSVFELFVQADNSLARTQGGLGIGLTLVRQLVGMHGGRVEARSPGIGQGSEFSIYLPLLDFTEEKNAADDAGTVSESPSQRILVIDDMEDLAKLTSMLLRLRGYKVDLATSGRKGAEMAEMLRPSIVLCDIGMPDMDGYETARLIRQGEWGRKVILLALSGYGQDEVKQRATEAGFDGHLTKPVDIDVLQKLISDLAP